jgi:hypothetical protein
MNSSGRNCCSTWGLLENALVVEPMVFVVHLLSCAGLTSPERSEKPRTLTEVAGTNGPRKSNTAPSRVISTFRPNLANPLQSPIASKGLPPE